MANPEVPQPYEQFVVQIAEYHSPSSRIRGYQELIEFELRAPSPILVLGHDAFLDYQREEKLTPEVEHAIRQASREIHGANPPRGAYIGRAFYTTQIDNPHGPRTAAIYDEDEYVAEVIKFWDFVINQGYNREGSDIALILHPFINVMDPRPTYGMRPLGEGIRLPWSGGYAVLESSPSGPRVTITSTFGPDEAIQSCPSDEFEVDPLEGIVRKKRVAWKDRTWVPVGGDQYQPYPIPRGFENKQSLTDDELVAVAREAWKVFSRRPDTRVEFILQPEGVYIREIAPRGIIETEALFKFTPEEMMSGHVVVIGDRTDVTKITGTEAIVYFPPEAFRERSTDLFSMIAHLGLQRLVAYVYGSSMTSHPARALSEAGYSVIPFGETQLRDGLGIRISRNPDGSPNTEYLEPYQDAIVALDDVARLALGTEGQKAARIAIMRHNGLPVPDGFVITSDALWRWLEESGIALLIAQYIQINHVERDQAYKKIAELIRTTPFPETLVRHISNVLAPHAERRWIVRSTGPEDVQGKSLAGLYVSTPDLSRDQIELAIKETLASYFSPASVVALQSSGKNMLHIPVAVLVQEYIADAAWGAVVNTKSNELVVEIVSGSPERIVSHAARDFIRARTQRVNGDYDPHITKEVVGSAPSVDDDVLQEIFGTTLCIERLFQTWQDIELVVTKEGKLIILQARPL